MFSLLVYNVLTHAWLTQRCTDSVKCNILEKQINHIANSHRLERTSFMMMVQMVKVLIKLFRAVFYI